MATTFLEPGGDADFLVGTTNGFWSSNIGTNAVVTDFVHGGHKKSIKYAPGGDKEVRRTGVLTDAGTRISIYIYLVTKPSSQAAIIGTISSIFDNIFTIQITSAGVLQLWNSFTNQIGTNGATLSTGVWYRISLAYTITSTTINRFELFVNGVSSISVTNATLDFTSTSTFTLVNLNSDTTLDFRSSDHYIDDSSSLTDTGDIWVTAKRPNANGTINGFTTQIGAGGSGYGSGHSPQVNERPLSTTNGWSVSPFSSDGITYTEEYNVEGKSVGDINISTATIIDWLGWVSISALSGETGNVIIDGASVAQAITTTATLYTKIKGSATYPAGTGTDIGFQTTIATNTVSLYECGVLVAYVPPPPIVVGGLDSITISESITLFFPLPNINVSDSVSVSESITIYSGEPSAGMFGGYFGSIYFGQNYPSYGTAGVYTVSVSETVTISEVITSVATLAAISKSDSITTAEVTTSIASTTTSVSDTITLSESITIAETGGAAITVSVSDSITSTETTTISVTSFVSKADSITVSETVTTAGTEYVPIPWLQKYEANLLPQNSYPTWGYGSGGSPTVTVAGGELRAQAPTLNDLARWIVTDPNLVGDVRFRARVKVPINTPGTDYLSVPVLGIENGTYALYLYLLTDRIVFDSPSNFYLMDTTTYHTYELVGTGNHVQIYVDGALAIEADSFTGTPSSQAAFGIESNAGAIDFYIDYFYWGAKGDVIAVSENVSTRLSATKSASDSITLSESTDITNNNCVASISDSITASEVVSILEINYIINASDSITASESVSALEKNYIINISDVITISESVLITNPSEPTYDSDTITIFEVVSAAVSSTGVLAASVFDSITISETTTPNVQETGVDSDTITITETVLITNLNEPTSDSDTLTVSESVSILETNYVINISDAVTISETVSILETNYVINVSSPITVSETVSILETNYVINVSDTTTVSETIVITNPSEPTLDNDTITISESVLITNSSEPTSDSDTITVSENVSILETNYVINVSDTITVSEVVSILETNYVINISDTITISETTSTLEINYIVFVADSITTSEITSTAPSIEFTSIVDSITISEAVNVVVGASGTLIISVSDTVTISEVVNPILVLLVSVLDTIIIGESTIGYLGESEVDSDIITLSENISITNSFGYTSIDDTIVLNETASIYLGEVGTDSDTVVVSENVLITNSLCSATTGDSISVGESLSQSLFNQILVSDTVVPSEQITATNLFGYLATSDTISLVEELHSVASVPVTTIIDVIVVSELVSVINSSGLTTVADTITISESVTNSGVEKETDSDLILVTELVSTQNSMGPVVVSDSLTVGETTLLYLGESDVDSDTITISESALAVVGPPNTRIVDTVLLSEIIAVTNIVDPTSDSDQITITEIVRLMVTNFTTTSDSISVAENVSIKSSTSVRVSDILSILETIKSVATIADRVIFDTIIVGEALNIFRIYYVDVSDTIFLTEHIGNDSYRYSPMDVNKYTRGYLVDNTRMGTGSVKEVIGGGRDNTRIGQAAIKEMRGSGGLTPRPQLTSY